MLLALESGGLALVPSRLPLQRSGLVCFLACLGLRPFLALGRDRLLVSLSGLGGGSLLACPLLGPLLGPLAVALGGLFGAAELDLRLESLSLFPRLRLLPLELGILLGPFGLTTLAECILCRVDLDVL